MDWLLLLRKRIRSGYVLSFLLLLFSYCLIFYVQQRLAKETRWVIHSHVVINNSESLKAELISAETGMRGYLLTRDARFLEPYNAASHTIPSLCKELKDLVADNDNQRRNLDTLEQLITKRMDILSFGLTNFQTNRYVITDNMRLRLDSGRNMMDSARLYVSKIKEAEEKLVQARKKRLSG